MEFKAPLVIVRGEDCPQFSQPKVKHSWKREIAALKEQNRILFGFVKSFVSAIDSQDEEYLAATIADTRLLVYEKMVGAV